MDVVWNCLRCEASGNPCGTDTHAKHAPCGCPPCVADRRIAQLEQALEEKRGGAPCSVCAGEGRPTHGGPCICDGTGTMVGEMDGLRAECFRLREANTQLEQERDAQEKELHSLYESLKCQDSYVDALKEEIGILRLYSNRQFREKADEALARRRLPPTTEG